MGYIYKITNDVNGKVYIGKTLNTVEARWKEHCYDKDRRKVENRPLYQAMNKYGLQHFSIETVEECKTNLEEREVYWIKYYNSYIGWPNSNGYNATLGGDGKPYINYDMIRELANTEKTQVEIAAIVGCNVDTVAKVCLQNNQENYNYNKRISIAVYQKDKDGNIIAEYPTIKSAAEATLTSPSHIGQCCAGKRKTCGGYYWEYVNAKEGQTRRAISNQPKVNIPRETLKSLIREHPMEEIGRIYGCSAASIRRCCERLNLPRTKKEINSYSDEEWFKI